MTLDAGARQLVRMTLARPLGRRPDPARPPEADRRAEGRRLRRRRQPGRHRQDDHHRPRARAPRQHHATLPRARDRRGPAARPVARRAHRAARPAAGCRRWRRTSSCSMLDDRRSIAGQIRAFDRALGERPGVVLAPNGMLDRHPAELEAIAWHLLIADEALRYANPATDAHQALAQVRMGCVADCWLLTATPRGKSAEQLDVLVGLAVGDRGDDPRAPEHARGRRPARRNARPPAARELRPAPRARHPPGHAGLDARRPPRPAARRRTRRRAARAAGGDPPRRPRGLPASCSDCSAN